jgi:hypothetical protein
MIPIATASDVVLHSPEMATVAFSSSPYPVHVQGGAVDIFLGLDFGAPVPSPVSGKVVSVVKNKVGSPRYFEADPYDYNLIIQRAGLYVRIIHCKPEIKVGDVVKPGDTIGEFLRSPLLPFWSRPHIHVEIKRSEKSFGPKNSLSLQMMGEGNFQGEPELDYHSIEGHVISAMRNEVFFSPDVDVFGKVGQYHGVAVQAGGEFGILDAHTPWNCYGGVALALGSKTQVGDEVRLGKVLLGRVERIQDNMALYSLGGEVGDGIRRYSKGLLNWDVNRFNVPRRRIVVNGEEFLGFSTGLSLFENRNLRLIPKMPLKKKYEVGEHLEIELDPK